MCRRTAGSFGSDDARDTWMRKCVVAKEEERQAREGNKAEEGATESDDDARI